MPTLFVPRKHEKKTPKHIHVLCKAHPRHSFNGQHVGPIINHKPRGWLNAGRMVQKSKQEQSIFERLAREARKLLTKNA